MKLTAAEEAFFLAAKAYWKAKAGGDRLTGHWRAMSRAAVAMVRAQAILRRAKKRAA